MNLSLYLKDQRILSQEGSWAFHISDSPVQTQRFNTGLYETLPLAAVFRQPSASSSLIYKLVWRHSWLLEVLRSVDCAYMGKVATLAGCGGIITPGASHSPIPAMLISFIVTEIVHASSK